MNGWAPLWNGIVTSSIWDEPDHVVKVFLTMMALKDADHIVRFNAFQLSKFSRKSELEVLDALKILSSPDTKRVEKQEFDGRRVKAVEEGWLVLNGEKYRSMVHIEKRRANNRKAQKAFRERQKQKRSLPLPGEQAYCAAAENGASDAELDGIVGRHLPVGEETAL